MSDSRAFRSGKAGVLPLPAVALLLSACVSNTYMGIPLTEGAGDPTLRSLAESAAAGDKQAQLALGIIYEEGLGVPVSIATAKKLYRLASSDSGGTLWVYTPAVGKDVPGKVIPIDRGPIIQGLSEARSRLNRLGGRP